MLIKNGTLIDAAIIGHADIMIKDGKITRLEKRLPVPEGEETVIDASGYVIMPSFVDMHVHLRDPGYPAKETLETGVKAAVNGGYTHIIAMANTNPVVDNPETLSDIQARAKQLNLADVYQCSSVTKGLKGEELVDFATMRKLTQFFSDDGKNINNKDIFVKALHASQEYNFTILDHSEPEPEMVARNLELVAKEGGNLHLCHVSRKESMLSVIKAKDKGVNVTVEVTPHHLYAYNLAYRVNPPFATEEDVNFLLTAIREGYVDCISTDHAPHTPEDKANGAPGISGIEVAFGMVNKVFIDNDISIHELSRLMSKNPRRMLGLNDGYISSGNSADLVIVDFKNIGSVDPEDFISKGKNTPFIGAETIGSIVHTIKEGVILK
ncbi:MAG: dihydroorotase [Alphaproteobacteria bacterium]|nr:dihydroorotase [Alphaproteobacteria bacterium]